MTLFFCDRGDLVRERERRRKVGEGEDASQSLDSVQLD